MAMSEELEVRCWEAWIVPPAEIEQNSKRPSKAGLSSPTRTIARA